TAISPIDGRYRNQLQHWDEYFSEYALIKYRVWIEIEYFLCLADSRLFKLPAKARIGVKAMAEQFSLEDAAIIKATEKVTKHDVKAVEYFIKSKLEALALQGLKEWVHFGLTSQDINNTSIPLSWKHAMEFEYLPAVLNLINNLQLLATEWKEISLLARTHGQPASLTKLGKEIIVFVERLRNQVELLTQVPYAAKFGGATGNFNAHFIAYPKKNWISLGNLFVESLGLQRQQFTTQIEHYDNLAAHFDGL